MRCNAILHFFIKFYVLISVFSSCLNWEILTLAHAISAECNSSRSPVRKYAESTDHAVLMQ